MLEIHYASPTTVIRNNTTVDIMDLQLSPIDIEESVNSKVMVELFFKACSELLSADEESMVLQYYIEEKTFHQIAKQFNVSGEYVRRKIHAHINKIKSIYFS